MSEQPPTTTGPSRPPLPRHLDQICDHFEVAWRAAGASSTPPRIEAYLQLVSQPEQANLLPELIALDAAYRRLRGEAPHEDDYRALFPDIDPEALAQALALAPAPPTGRTLPRRVPAPVDVSAILTGGAPDTLLTNALPAEPDDWLVGRTIGVYRIEQLLGRGGMGMVYQAEDTILRRRVAIKVLPKWAWGDSAGLNRLLREARALAHLNHPHIVTLHHVEQGEGGFFLVLEFMAGGSLQARLGGGKAMPWPEATRAMIEACSGLQAAHAAGFVHRDIKPANLLCDSSGLVKVADFGLVRGDLSNLSSSSRFAGTANYMSPEQCRAETVDGRSDLYALGATYFSLLTGHPPYSGDSPLGIMSAHCEAVVPDPRSFVPNLPEGCTAIVRKAMAKQPGDRFQTAEEMRLALLALLHSTSRTTNLIAAPSSVRRSSLRPAVGMLTALLLLAGIAGVAALIWPNPHGNVDSNPDGQKHGEKRLFPPVKAFGVELPQHGHVVSLRGRVAAVTFSRDGKMLAAGAVHPLPDSPPMRGAMIWDTATGKELHRLWPKLPIFCLGFSRDGGLLMGSSDRSLIYFPAKDEQVLCCHDIGEIQSLSFARDGSILALGFSSGHAQGRVKRWVYNGEEIGPSLGKDSGAPVQQILFSPHDNTLAVAHRNGQVFLYPPDDPPQAISIQPERPGSPPALAFAPDRPLLAVAQSRELSWWNLEQRVREKQTVVEEEDITALAYTPDGQYLAVASRKPDVVLRSVSTGQKVYLQGHREGVNTIAIHPDGEILATGSRDGEVRIWNLRAAIAKAAQAEK